MTFDYKSCPLKKRPFVHMAFENCQQYNSNYVSCKPQSEALALIKSARMDVPQDLSINSSALDLSTHHCGTPLDLSLNNKVFDSLANYFHKKNDNVITHIHENNKEAKIAKNLPIVNNFHYANNQFRKSFVTAAGCKANNSFWSVDQPNLNTIYPSPNSSITSDVSGQTLHNCQQFSPPLSLTSELISEPEDLSITKDIPLPALFHDLNETNTSRSKYAYCNEFSSNCNSADMKISAGKAVSQTNDCRLKCGNCQKLYSTVVGLRKHQQFHCSKVPNNKEKKEFKCEQCDKPYKTKAGLKMHIHTHTLPCKCEVCGKAFSRRWLLRGHLRTHTGEKPFQCPVCSRSFADRSNLKAHQKIHSKSRKYTCNRCNKTFSRRSFLNKHMDGGCANASN